MGERKITQCINSMNDMKLHLYLNPQVQQESIFCGSQSPTTLGVVFIKNVEFGQPLYVMIVPYHTEKLLAQICDQSTKCL